MAASAAAIDSQAETEASNLSVATYSRPLSQQSWLPHNWRPTSSFSLAYAESLVLRSIKNCHLDTKFVQLPCGAEIRTLIATAESNNPNYMSRTPLLLLHGMGAGIGLWCKNISELAKSRPVYAIDLLGFGRSSRIAFPSEAEACERRFVDSIEQWRSIIGLDSFLLLGHSFGGYLAFCYSLSYRCRVVQLLLADPWGLLEPPDDYRPSRLFAHIAYVVQRWDLDPLDALRAAGPLGPTLLRRFRTDIRHFFSDCVNEQDIIDYIYHCNAQVPSGETGFKRLTRMMAFASRPCLPRVGELAADLPVVVVCGGRSRLYRLERQRGLPQVGHRLAALRPPESGTRVLEMPECGHHVYAQDAETFNRLIVEACEAF